MCELLSHSRANHPYLAQPCISTALRPHGGQTVLPQTQPCVSWGAQVAHAVVTESSSVCCPPVPCRATAQTTKVPIKACGPGQKSHSIQPGDIKEGRGCQCPWRPSVISPYQHLQSWFMRDPPFRSPPKKEKDPQEGLFVWTVVNRHSQTFSHTKL